MGVTATNGIGKDFFESISKEEKAKGLNKIDKITNATNLLEKDGDLTPQGNATKILKDVNKIFGTLFPYNEELMENLSEQIKQISGKHISPKKKNQIFKFVRSFLYSKDNTLYGEKDISQLRRELLLETKTNKSLAKRWKDYLKDNPSHFFAKRLFPNVKFGGNVPSTIRFINVSGGSREDDSQITIELISMLETGTNIEKQLAHDLIVYNFIIGGNQDAYNIIKYLPADYLNHYGFGNQIEEGFNWKSKIGNDVILRQYFQHAPKEAYQLSANKELTKFEEGKEGFIISEEETLPKYVAYFDNSKKGKNSYVLFENDGTNRYIRLPLLGYRGFLETNINTGDSINESIYFKNPVTTNKPMSGKEYMEMLKKSEMTEQELKIYNDNLALKAGIDIDMTPNKINVYWGQAESETSTKILSNLAPRKFVYQGKEYGSVEHAYQSLKSGQFDQDTYNKYIKAGGYGTKIRGKSVNKGFDNLQLMKDLVVESFKQNPNSESSKKLLQYSEFTHNTNEIIDKAFLEGLYLAQKELLNNFKSLSNVQKELELETVDSKQVEEKIAECEGDIKVGSSSKFSNFKI